MLGILDDFLRFLGDLGAQKIWLSTAIVVATVIILSTTTTCQSIVHLAIIRRVAVVGLVVHHS